MNKEIIDISNREIQAEVILEKKSSIRDYMYKEEIREVLGNMPPGKNKVLLTTMWMTGLRVSEVINIRKCDINFGHNIMTVRWLKNRKYNERIVPIKRELSNILQLYTMSFKWDQVLFPLTRQAVYKICKAHFNRKPHSLRHSFAVNFLSQCESPMGIVILKNLLGHSRIETTMEYLKIVPFDSAKALETIKY